jgi:hypothetical protein
MTERSAATRLVALRVLKDAITEADTQARADIQTGMAVGDRTTAVVHLDGEAVVVGHVQLTKGSSSTTAAVTDTEALLAWVKEHCPSEVQTIELVRSSFQKVLLDRVKADGGWYDEATGEILDVPGVTVTPGTPRPTLVVKPAEGAAEVVRAAWASGALPLTDLTALPGGDAA